MKTYEHLTMDQERALYGLRDAEVLGCTFAGPADGESALKESRRIVVRDCDFQLRYPFWHTEQAELERCHMAEGCRAALWYDKDVTLRDCTLHGIKALRECDRTRVDGCQIQSPEFGWFCRGLRMSDTRLVAEYPFLRSRDMAFDRLTLQGKYSFQYAENTEIRNSHLDTKDAFWHSKQVTVVDSVIRGEYLGWYSEGLRLVRCKIIGTQPLCYANGLVLEDCEMEQADFSFEYSEVQATLRGEVLSVKNPKAGRIEAEAIGEILWDEHRLPGAACEIVSRREQSVTA